MGKTGLEIAEQCFNSWCLPSLQRNFPDISERVAACVLWGSQAIGNDDIVSTDHEWGPTFELVLTEDDYAKTGISLQAHLNDTGKTDYVGYAMTPGSRNLREKSARGENILDANVHVSSLPEIMSTLFKHAYPLQGLSSWKYLDESVLYFCRHGKIFYDPLQYLTKELKPYRNYPEPILKRRIVVELRKFCMFASFNYGRIVKRNDPVTLSICRTNLVNSVMTLVMLLNGDYVPYFKWLHTEFLKQPNVTDVDNDLMLLLKTDDSVAQLAIVRRLEEFIQTRLKDTGYSRSFMRRFETEHTLEGTLAILTSEVSEELLYFM